VQVGGKNAFSVKITFVTIRRGGSFMETSPNNRIVETKAGAEMEYATLKDEILRRLDARQQFLSIMFTIAGAYLGVGWSLGDSAVPLLIYPILPMLLAAAWAQNEIQIRELTTYIRNNLESSIPGLGWENYRRRAHSETQIAGFSVDILAYGSIFLIPQILALLLGFFRIQRISILELILLIIGVLAILAVFVLIGQIRRSD
jgi:hypothetical protein